MSYQEVKYIDGSSSQKMGGRCVIESNFAIFSGYNEGDILIYRKGEDGVWEEIGSKNESASTGQGFSLDLYRGLLAVGSNGAGSEEVKLYSYTDNFNSTVQTLSPTIGGGGGFGSSVSISENYIAVGAPYEDSNKGEVYIFEYMNGTWTEYTSIILPEIRSNNQYFGCSVAINDSFLIVGAMGDNSDKGAVYIFEKDEEEWIQSKKLLASDGKNGDQFGGSISLSGDYLAIGAEYRDIDDDVINAGAVYLFKYAADWYEIDIIVGTGFDDLSGGHFGHSLDLNGDYLIVGSPDIGAGGSADIFYKNRGWGHLKKLSSNNIGTGENFGESVSIDHPYSIVGSSEYSTDYGRVYIYEDPPIRFRLAQEFDVNSSFLPSKVSLYLRKVGLNTQNYWAIYNTSDTTIDASNFSEISQGLDKYIFSDEVNGFSDNGYVYLDRDDNANFGVIEYPIRAINIDIYKIWIRYGSFESSNFKAELLLDGERVGSVDTSLSNPSSSVWAWTSFNLVLPDNINHTLGFRIKEKGCAIDKIYITSSSFVPYGFGPYKSQSPYFTAHLQIYMSDGEKPTTPLFIYDYKNSCDEIIKDDWYNFNVNVIDNYHGFTSAIDFSGSYFIVLSLSGSNSENFAIWEMEKNDEYFNVLSAFRI